MSKLNKKFLLSISIVLLLVGVLSLYLNLNVIERYFLHKEKKEISMIGNKLTSSNVELKKTINDIKKSEDVVIAWVENSKDNNLLNDRLRQAFYEQGISLNKYWFWEKDQDEVIAKGKKLKVYTQEKLNYSFLVEYLFTQNSLIAVGKIVPSLDKTLELISRITVIIFIATGILLFLCISILVYKITSPIKKIREASKSIADLEFTTIEIDTKDELELLARDINEMSNKLYKSHNILTEKNHQMEDFLANVSHDLKTPISLIKMYSCGMKDGIDDGTFLDTIILQNNRMEKIIEKLLNLAKVQQQECEWKPTNVSHIIKELLNEYRLQEESMAIRFDSYIEDSIILRTNAQAIQLIISNMISNAVKYSKDGYIKIKFYGEEKYSIFYIENPINANSEIDIEKIWQPFYVGEKSRNKTMSGTGLGLSIVKEVCEKYNIKYKCGLKDNMISFKFKFENNE